MVRQDDDSWDVTESVGQTAIQVALGRMVETVSDAPLFIDHHARVLVEAAIASGWTSPFTEDLLTELTAADPKAPDRLLAMQDYTAVRTRFFDDFLRRSSRRGMRQVVNVAAGLDARAWRLQSLLGSTVYEIDRLEVLTFKTRTLEVNEVQPIAQYVAVAADLRHDWRHILRQAGFDQSQPTSWIVEGLLPYLSGADQDLLFERIDSLSATGSRIAVEAFDERFYDRTNSESGGAQLVGRAAAMVGGRIASTHQLFYLEQHADVNDWLNQCGWATEAVDAVDMMDRLGRPVREDLRDSLIESVFVTGER